MGDAATGLLYTHTLVQQEQKHKKSYHMCCFCSFFARRLYAKEEEETTGAAADEAVAPTAAHSGHAQSAFPPPGTSAQNGALLRSGVRSDFGGTAAGCTRPKPASHAPASFSSLDSDHAGPISCSPIGSFPCFVAPTGKEMPGWPVQFARNMKRIR